MEKFDFADIPGYQYGNPPGVFADRFYGNVVVHPSCLFASYMYIKKYAVIVLTFVHPDEMIQIDFRMAQNENQ